MEEIVNDIKDYVDNNLILNSIHTNDLTNYKHTNVVYPTLILGYGDVTAHDGYLDIKFEGFFLDLMEDDKSNRVKIISDTLLSVADFRIFFRDVQTSMDECKYYMLPETNIVDTEIIELNTDITTGKRLEFIIRVPNTANVADIPMKK